jgi:alpha-L-fucosidase
MQHGPNGCNGKSEHPLGGQGPFVPAEGEGCCVGDGNSRQWFWHPDHDAHAALKTVDMFVDEYHRSVGLGSNMLVGMTADRRGLVPSNDAAKVARVGRFIRRCYGAPIASSPATARLQLSRAEDHIDLQVPRGQTFDRVWLREDISTGQRARGFRVLVLEEGSQGFVQVAEGSSVARKRIVVFNTTMAGVRQLRFQVTAAAQWPVPMTEVAAFAPCGRA